MSLLDALNDFSICKLLGRILKIFAPWNEKVLRPVSVLTFGITKLFVVFAGVHFVILPCEVISKRFWCYADEAFNNF